MSQPRCPRCLEETDFDRDEVTDEITCWSCCKRNFSFDRLYAGLEFQGQARLALNNLKFSGRLPLAHSLSQAVLKNLPAEFNHAQYDFLLPVPLHWLRRWQRGFNQTTEIARHLAKEWRLPMNTKILKRIKAAPPQTKSTFNDRKKQVKGRFAVNNSDLVQDKRILIFDDITTTRFTIDECAAILKAAGARLVDVLTVAISVK